MINAHYLPRTYLKGFTQNNKSVQRFSIKYNSWKEKDVEQVAYEKDLYSFNDDEGNRHDEVESLILPTIENPYRRIIVNLEQKKKLSSQEFEDLFVFLSFLVFRSPRTKNFHTRILKEVPILNIKDRAIRFPELLKEDYEAIKDTLPIQTTWEEFRQQMENLDPLKLDLDRNMPTSEYLVLMANMAEKIYKLFRTLNVKFVFSNEGEIFTGDFPYFINNDPNEDKGFLTGDTYIPLSKHVCLALSPNPHFKKNSIKAINQGMTNAADEFLFCPQRFDLTDYIKNRSLIMRPKLEFIEVEDGLLFKQSHR